MKIIRFGPKGQERWGLVDARGRRRDASGLFKASGTDDSLDQVLARLSRAETGSLPEVPESERHGAPIRRPGKVICIGLNYSDHAAESGMDVPEEPVLFFKASQTVVGPFDEVLIPHGGKKTDWEVELGVVIGKTARYLDSPNASAEYIAGYCVSNDVSERAFQLERSGQWCKGKSCDTFNPLGPWLVTPDEIPQPDKLDLWLDVNGQRRQTGNTATMVFGVPHLVWYISQFMTLEPGDLISTGTPPGVGLGLKPPVYLKPGDTMRLGITGLGEQQQTCGAA